MNLEFSAITGISESCSLIVSYRAGEITVLNVFTVRTCRKVSFSGH
jgi:hypothetical protein